MESRKVCHFFDFGSIPLPRIQEALSRTNMPFMPIVPVLVANLLRRNGQASVAKGFLYRDIASKAA
jgi:hypothetical protein